MLGITDFWTYVLGTVAIVLLPGPNSIFVLSVAAQRGVRAGYRAASGVFVGDTVLMVLAAAGVASVLKAYPPIFMVVKYAGGAYLAWVGFGIIRSGWRKWRERGAATSDRRSATGTDESSAAIADRERATGTEELGTAIADGRSGTGAGEREAGVESIRAGMDGSVQLGVASARQLGEGFAQPMRRDGGDGESDTGKRSVAAGMRRPFRRALVVSLLNPKAILFVVSFFIQFVDPEYAHPAVPFLILGAILQVFSFLYLSGLIFGGQFLAGQFRRRRRLSAAAATGIGALFVGFGVKLATATAG